MQNELSPRHIGISEADEKTMLKALGIDTLDALIAQTVPSDIRLKEPLRLSAAMPERAYLEHSADLASQNKLYTTYIGQGWYDTITPSVILRNVLENPVWYTSYTPYQAEISQGRLEALLLFQTAVADFTGLPLANCSLLDEATAAAEAVTMMYNLRSREQQKAGVNRLFVTKDIFPHTLAVVKTRAACQGIEVVVGDYESLRFSDAYFGILLQYPNATGAVENYAELVEEARANGCKVAVAADVLSLAILPSPGSWGADICFGSTQRWGIPMGYGGPAAAYFATREEYKRDMPGRIIGISKDVNGKAALRMALQTREQHIKREKASSNICTAQALMATMAALYTVYHGANGMRAIAQEVHGKAAYLNELLAAYGYTQTNQLFFDTLHISLSGAVQMQQIKQLAEEYEVNFFYSDDTTLSLSLDETTDIEDMNVLIDIFATASNNQPRFIDDAVWEGVSAFEESQLRAVDYLQHEVFAKYHSETEMMRYIKRLERKDISLAHSMIPLGSCTMKLNAASEMIPVSWMQWGAMHPMAPLSQAEGYRQMLEGLSSYLCTITGFTACSLQPTSGAIGEFAGVVAIRGYLEARGESHRNVLLIPASAHGTNPATATQAGFVSVIIKSNEQGNTDLADWRAKAEEHQANLAGCMITYPSTHGVFETDVVEMCQVVHACGGLVYMDGANMNAQVGLTNPAVIGADVCHLNLHKTFASPHGGGGPGMGAICVNDRLKPYLPTETDRRVSASLFGNAGIASISYGYITMMGIEGLMRATKIAILNANYLAQRLHSTYGVLYTGAHGRVGHELILDCRGFKHLGITESDIAKRLMDYGFHAPTLSFPVHGTLMVEPTESESLAELDRFADTMLSIYEEIMEIERGEADKTDNVLLNAPHPEYAVLEEWHHAYSRQKAYYPTEAVAQNKFWIPVGRVDNGFGDRNLVAKL